MKIIFRILLIIMIAFMALFIVRFVFGGPEDDWICANGEWTKHGNPSAPMPQKSCK